MTLFFELDFELLFYYLVNKL